MMKWTHIGRISISYGSGSLQATIRDAHPECRSNPRHSLVVRQTHSFNDHSNRDKEAKPEGVQAGFWHPHAIVLLCVPQHHPVGQPACIRLANQTADEQRYRQHKTSLRDREAIEFSKQLRARRCEEDAAVSKGSHVVKAWNSDGEILQHVEVLPEVLQLQLALWKRPSTEEDPIEVCIWLVVCGYVSRVQRLRQKKQVNRECAELDEAWYPKAPIPG